MRSGRKSFAAPGSAGVNDGTAGFGAHPSTKTMASFAFYIAWLKRSFTHFYILSGCPCCLKVVATPLFDAAMRANINTLHRGQLVSHHAGKSEFSKIH